MHLIIHRGTKEIGGTCIELVGPSSRIILDLGMPLVDKDREPFDPRSIQGRSIDELLTTGVLPRVSGLFGPGPAPDAILLSHAHLDHSGLLYLSRQEIPIYASKGTSKMMLAAEVFGGQAKLERSRHVEITAGKPFTVGDFRITPFAVDHSAFDSLAFLIDADGKTVLYSGDLRMHGRKPGMRKTLLNGVSNKRIDVLLMEGTHFGAQNEQGLSEQQLEERIVEEVGGASGLVLAAFSPADVDRLVTFYRAARRTGRTFVADLYTAFVLHLVSGQARIPRAAKEAGIRVYLNQAAVHRVESLQEKLLADRITLQEILDEPTRHLMVFRPSMVSLDFGGTLPAGCRCLYSYWKGYLKNPEWIELQEQIAKFGGDFIPLHASGHIYVKDIIEFVRAINPGIVVPIHTFEPQAFREHFPNTHLLEDGKPHEIH